MRRTWPGLGLLVAAVFGAGCHSTDEHLRPERPPEEYRVPPEHDRRYDQPVEYPKEAMDRDPLQQKAKEKENGPPGSRFSGPGGRMGGGY